MQLLHVYATDMSELMIFINYLAVTSLCGLVHELSINLFFALGAPSRVGSVDDSLIFFLLSCSRHKPLDGGAFNKVRPMVILLGRRLFIVRRL